MSKVMATESVESVVEEMRTELERLPFPPEVTQFADRILSAHRAAMSEALAEPTHDEIKAFCESAQVGQSIVKGIIASRRKRLMP